MPVLLLIIITVLNDGTLMTIGYDTVPAAQFPQRWNLRLLFLISSVLAVVSCASSLLMLWLGLDSVRSNSFFGKLNMSPLDYGQVITLMYLKISVSDFLTLFACRTGPNFFFTSMPAPMVLGGAFVALATSTVLACTWPNAMFDGQQTEGISRNRNTYGPVFFTWIYCIVWWFVQDAAKVLTYYLVDRFDIFEYHTLAHPEEKLQQKPAVKREMSKLERFMAGTLTTACEPLIRRTPSQLNNHVSQIDIRARRAQSMLVRHFDAVQPDESHEPTESAEMPLRATKSFLVRRHAGGYHPIRSIEVPHHEPTIRRTKSDIVAVHVRPE